MVSRKAFKLMADKIRDESKVLERNASRKDLREVIRCERLKVSLLRNDLVTLTIERDYLVRTVNMLKMKLAAVDAKFVSKRTWGDIGKMLRRRVTGHRIKEISGIIRMNEGQKKNENK